MKSNKAESLFVNTYARGGDAMVSGKGSYLVDAKGKKYLDFGSGIAVTSLGHSNPHIVKAVKEQVKNVLHTSNLYYSQPQIDIAKLLLKNSFADKVFLCNSGTEANEAAIKFSRKWAIATNPKKFNILSFEEGFHGRTYGGLSATAQTKFHEGFGPILEGFHYAPFNNISATKAILEKHPFAAVIVEPIQGESGVNAATPEFLHFLRDYTTQNGIALIFDEIQCGTGRCGTLWCYEQYGVVPDIMTLAKPIGGGLPLGVTLVSEAIASVIKPGDHGTTFGGNPLACALGAVVIDTVSKKAFLKEVKQKGEYLIAKLEACATANPNITKVLGVGLLVGVRFTDVPLDIIDKARAKGLLLVKAGNNTVRFLPPLTVSYDEIDKAVEIFESVLF